MYFLMNALILVAILAVVLIIWQIMVGKEQRKSTLKVSLFWIAFGLLCWTVLYVLELPTWV